jgi:hypothetical protein
MTSAKAPSGPGETGTAGAFTQQGDGEQRGEHGLDLQHEGGEPGGHALVHADEEQAELGHTEGESHRDDPAQRDLGAGDEEDSRHGGDEKAQGAEEQRREVVEPDVDDHEVDAPEGGHKNGEGEMGGTHDGR